MDGSKTTVSSSRKTDSRESRIESREERRAQAVNKIGEGLRSRSAVGEIKRRPSPTTVNAGSSLYATPHSSHTANASISVLSFFSRGQLNSPLRLICCRDFAPFRPHPSPWRSPTTRSRPSYHLSTRRKTRSCQWLNGSCSTGKATRTRFCFWIISSRRGLQTPGAAHRASLDGTHQRVDAQQETQFGLPRKWYEIPLILGIQLINRTEVVQQSKMRSKHEFVSAYSPIIAEATSAAYKGSPSETQVKIRRVVEVWRQRAVFERSVQEATEKLLDGTWRPTPFHPAQACLY